MARIGKLIAFIGILVVAINQYFELVSRLTTENIYHLLGVGIIIFFMGIYADQLLDLRKL